MNKRFITTCLLVAYSTILVKVMVFKELPLIRIGKLKLNLGGTQTGAPNLRPLKNILPYLLGEKGGLIANINIFGNILLLVPVGLLVPVVFRDMTWKKCAVLAVAAGLAIEGMQALFRVGIFDVDDIILNGLGVLLGYCIYLIWRRWRVSGTPAYPIS